MKVNSKKAIKVDKVKFFSNLEQSSRVFGRMTELLERVEWSFQTETIIKETFKIAKKTVEESTSFSQEPSTKEILKTRSSTEKVFLSTKTEILTRVPF